MKLFRCQFGLDCHSFGHAFGIHHLNGFDIMPPAHGRRLAALLPRTRLVEIPDSYTLIPEDQPGELARAIRQFVRDTP